MARKLAPTFIPTSGKATGSLLPLDEIPAEVKAEVEEIYAALKTHDGRMHVAFDTKAELNTYILQVNSYCEQREAGKIRFRKSPARGLGDAEMHFRITDPTVEGETTTAAPAEGEKRKPGRPRKAEATQQKAA